MRDGRVKCVMYGITSVPVCVARVEICVGARFRKSVVSLGGSPYIEAVKGGARGFYGRVSNTAAGDGKMTILRSAGSGKSL